MKVNSCIASVAFALLLAMGMCKDINLDGRPTVSDEEGRPLSFLLIILNYFAAIDRAAGRFRSLGEKENAGPPGSKVSKKLEGLGINPNKLLLFSLSEPPLIMRLWGF